jgi:hypothetical protein
MAAGTSKPASAGTVKAIVLKCKVSLTTEPPAGSDSVSAPSQGNQYGPVHCPKKTIAPAVKGFGSGVEGNSFTIPDSGDTVGRYTQYFGDGTVHGTFDLTPGEGSTSGGIVSFQGQTWAGTLKVTGGTGAYKGIQDFKATKGKKGKAGKKSLGTMSCTSADGVHMTCSEKVKLMMPASGHSAQPPLRSG